MSDLSGGDASLAQRIAAPRQDEEKPPYEVKRMPDGSVKIMTGSSTWSVRALPGASGATERYVARVIHEEKSLQQMDLYRVTVMGETASVEAGTHQGIINRWAEEQFLDSTNPNPLADIKFEPVNLAMVEKRQTGYEQGVNWNGVLDEITTWSGILPGSGGMDVNQPFVDAGIPGFRQVLQTTLRASRV